MKAFMIGLFSVILLVLANSGVVWAAACGGQNAFANAVVVIGVGKNGRVRTFLCDGGYPANDKAKPIKVPSLPPGTKPSVSATVKITKYKKPGVSDPCILLESPWGGSELFCWE